MQALRAFLLPWLAACVLAAVPAAHAQKQEREATGSDLSGLAEVGKGQKGRQGLKPGAYITPKHRQAVQAYLASHHGDGKRCLPGMRKASDGCAPGAGAGSWDIGTALPATARARRAPAGLLGVLPKAPPGNEYVLLGGDILLIGSSSRIVVDAIPVGAGNAGLPAKASSGQHAGSTAR